MNSTLKDKVFTAARVREYAFTPMEWSEIRGWYRQTFHDSFDIHCGPCASKAIDRIVKHMTNGV